MKNLKGVDAEVHKIMKKELKRQRESLEMIPSENFASPAVMEAVGSILTNKYSEGYPGRRYYGGNEFVDMIENLAIERAKSLFGVPYANVQPYSGSPANLAIYAALCKPGDAVMGMNLTDGGHLTHGWKTSITGQYFKSIPYHVKSDGYIDLDEARRLAEENKPKLIWIGATAYTRALPFKEFAEIADRSGAYLAADVSHVAGLIIAGVHESPRDFADIIMTTTHKTLRGPRGAIIMVTEKGMKKDPELSSKIEKAVFPGLQGGPHDHTTAGIAVALLEASKPEFKAYGEQVVKNARALAGKLSAKGIKLVTGGTDNHMLLADLTPIGSGMGLFAQEALDKANITVNKNTIPNEPFSPFYPSGIRLGTPAITTRGMREAEMDVIGDYIVQVIDQIRQYSMPESKEERQDYVAKFRKEIKKNNAIKEVRTKVIELCKKFPLYADMSI
ncbi:MAG: serine hydroxymethyltransferase [Candidatus Micrarchaeaceae archaeon]